GRPRRLGRDRPRDARRRHRRAPVGPEREAANGRRGTRPPPRPGDRAHRQLVEPGALRQAHGPPVGPHDRPRASAGAVSRPADLPPDLPVRAGLRPDRGGPAPPRRSEVPDQATRALRALRLLLHLRAVLRGAAPGRPGPPLRGAAAERLGLDRRLLLLDGVLRLVAVLPPRRRRAEAGDSHVAGGSEDGDSARPRSVTIA